MPGRKRVCTGGDVFSVLNRAVGGQQVFRDDEDDAAFERVLIQGLERTPVR